MSGSHRFSLCEKTNTDVVSNRNSDIKVIIDIGGAQLSKHIEYQSGSFSSSLPSNQGFEQDHLVSMKKIEKRAMQIISQYAKQIWQQKASKASIHAHSKLFGFVIIFYV